MMRCASVVAVLVSGLALSACGGGGGGKSGLTKLKGDQLLCDLTCLPQSDPSTTTPPKTGPGTKPGGGAAGGNSTNLKTGDTTIALELSKVVVPPAGQTSLSTLSATPAEILAPTKPGAIKIQVDTNTSSNGTWAVPIKLSEYKLGTDKVEGWDGGHKGGADYHEYRTVSTVEGKERDEELQVWAWGDSYATQYRNAIGGPEAVQQAWSFGGNKTAPAEMPTGGGASYNGRFVATAKTENYESYDGDPVQANHLWRVQGKSRVDADFGTGAVTGTLTPETWTTHLKNVGDFTQKVGGGYYMDSSGTLFDQNVPVPHTNSAPAYYGIIYDTKVTMTGTIQNTVTPTGVLKGSTYAGTASVEHPDGYVSADNPMYGGFFGTGAKETTGIFTVKAMTAAPTGGSTGINGDRRASLTINGAFHGTCAAGGACSP